MSNLTTENTPEIIYVKEQLYKFYYELMKEIKEEEKPIDDQEYEETVLNSKINTIINYIKESLLLLKKKIKSKKETKIPQNLSLSEKYENKMKKYENEIRGFIKTIFQYKIQCEALEMKLEAYMEMEQEFEEMKEKLKYEEGTFLDNDRKDHEIVILRAENSNLKKVIEQLEKDKKNFEAEKQNDKEMINDLKTQIEKLAKKVKRLEQNQKDLNTNSNSSSSINININNNTNAPSKWVINHDNEYNNNINHNNMFNNTYNRILNDFSTNTKSNKNICASASSKKESKAVFTPHQKKGNHHKTKSMNMNDNEKKAELMSKYFASHYQTNTSNKSSMKKLNSNYVKMASSSKVIIGKNGYISNKNNGNNFNSNMMISSLSKMYLPNSKGNKSANRTMVSVRSSSRLSDHL